MTCRYKAKVNLYANLWREPVLTPVQEATYWVETLAKYKSFDQLIVKDYNLYLLQYFSIDVASLLLLCACLLLSCAFYAPYR